MREIKMWGSTLEETVRALIQFRVKGEDVYCDFNGTVLKSSDVTFDNAYLAVTGMTYTKFQENEKRRIEKWKQEEEEYKKSIPNLRKRYLVDSLHLISPEQIDEWIKVVDARLSDLYKGFDLASAIEIMNALDGGASIGNAKNIIDNQGHSGMSYGAVRLVVKQFSPRGQEFWDATQM